MANSNEYMKAYMNKRYHALRAEYIALLGGQCVDCGCIDELEFDHVDYKTKTYAIAKILTHRREKVLAELAKCVLRCKECHIEKSRHEISEMKTV